MTDPQQQHFPTYAEYEPLGTKQPYGWAGDDAPAPAQQLAPYSYAPPPVAYGQPHPNATLVLVLGIVGLVAAPVVSPFAVWLGLKARREIRESGGRLVSDGQLTGGLVLGIIGSAILALVVALVALFFLGAVVS